jgi:hypothetical protein
MSEAEHSSSEDRAEGSTALAGLAEGAGTLGSGHAAERTDPAGADAQGGSPLGLRSTAATQRGLPAVQPALASLLPPVAPQLHLARASFPSEPQGSGEARRDGTHRASQAGSFTASSSDADARRGLDAHTRADSDDDDDTPTNVPPRDDGPAAEAGPHSPDALTEPDHAPASGRPPIVPEPAMMSAAPVSPGWPEPAVTHAPSAGALFGTPDGARLGSSPKPVPAPPGLPPFAQALYSAGLLAELKVESLGGLPRLPEPAAAHERLDFLEAYYAAGTDPVVSLRRRATDRWFIYDASQPLAGPQLVQRLTFVLPELAHAHLERVGGKHGTLLLRAGEHVCALDDDQSVRGNPTVPVGEIVRGMNVLMERRGERVRLVGLVGDGVREAYLGIGSLTLALALTKQELLTARDTESLMHLTGW